MMSRTAAVAYAAIATTTFAATANDGRPHEARRSSDPDRTFAGIGWMPAWLREPVSKALKDANDPRGRKR